MKIFFFYSGLCNIIIEWIIITISQIIAIAGNLSISLIIMKCVPSLSNEKYCKFRIFEIYVIFMFILINVQLTLFSVNLSMITLQITLEFSCNLHDLLWKIQRKLFFMKDGLSIIVDLIYLGYIRKWTQQCWLSIPE